MVEQPLLKMDKQAAIKQLESDESMASAKHVDIRVKSKFDYARKGMIKPESVESRAMMAELLTKALPAPNVAELHNIFNLK